MKASRLVYACLAACVVGCGAEAPAPTQEGRSPGTVPPSVVELTTGSWEGLGGSGWFWLEIEASGLLGGYRLRCSRREGDEPTPVNRFVRATWQAPVLTCDRALLGEERWHLLRSEED